MKRGIKNLAILTKPIAGLGLILAGCLGFLILEGSVLAQVVPQQAAVAHVLHSRVHSVVTNLTSVGSLPAATRLNLVIGLPARNQPDLDTLLQQLYDPASTNFHHFLTPVQFTARFGPTEADYLAVINFAKTNGLQVVGSYDSRKMVDVSAAVSDIEKAFHVTLRMYQHPTESRQFYAPDVEASVDAGLPILDVSGLNNYVVPHPLSHQRTKNGTAGTASGSAPDGSYIGSDFRNAYIPGVTLNGSGQSVGLVQFEGYYSNDIAIYESNAKLPNAHLQNVYSDGMTGIPNPTDTNGIDECSLDIEMAISMAPGLAKVYVFEGTVTDHILGNMVTNSQINQFSSSWSMHNDATAENYLQQMACQGQSFFMASGDGDAWCDSTTRDWPCDDPWVTSVGGTELTMNSNGVSYASESVWNSGYDTNGGWPVTDNGYWGSGGGVSSTYSMPGWQLGVNLTAVGGSTNMRNFPDVALVADNVHVRANNEDNDEMGTSIAAPLWAGFMALVNQQRAANGASPIGFLNPALYSIGQSPNYTSCFHDITNGNNINSCSPSKFYAAPDYDLCTGWGTIGGSNLINNLAIGFSITPSKISSAYTGGIILQIDGLTNGGTVVVQKYLDLNTNGVIDAGDWLVQQFTLTDGQAGMVIGGVNNFNVPGDTDGTVNGNITATLNFPGGDFSQNIVGRYLYRLSSPVNHFAPVTRWFTITNFPFGQQITGTVVNDTTGTSVPNAVVLLFPTNGPPVAGTVANNAGGYSLLAMLGTYSLIAISSDSVANLGTPPVITLSSGQTVTMNLTAINATTTISGNVVDSSNSSMGLPGVNVLAESASGLIGVAFTDSNGNYTVPVTAGAWGITPNSDALVVHGYVGLANVINVNAGTTGVTLAVPKDTALFYGSVKDNLGNPLPFLDVNTDDNDHPNNTSLYYTESFTEANGDYVLGVVGFGTSDSWWVVANDVNENLNYVFTPGLHAGNVSINAGQAELRNFTALPANNLITGSLKDNYGNPIVGVEIYASTTINGLDYDQAMDTDTNGNYWLNVCNGNWDVVVAFWEEKDMLPSNYLEPADQYPVISDNNAEADFVATNLLTSTLPPVILSPPQVTGGKTNFTFLLSGPAGSNYVLQVSTNLLNWSPVSTSTIPVSGSITLTNAINGYKQSFYRVHLQ